MCIKQKTYQHVFLAWKVIWCSLRSFLYWCPTAGADSHYWARWVVKYCLRGRSGHQVNQIFSLVQSPWSFIQRHSHTSWVFLRRSECPSTCWTSVQLHSLEWDWTQSPSSYQHSRRACQPTMPQGHPPHKAAQREEQYPLRWRRWLASNRSASSPSSSGWSRLSMLYQYLFKNRNEDLSCYQKVLFLRHDSTPSSLHDFGSWKNITVVGDAPGSFECRKLKVAC